MLTLLSMLFSAALAGVPAGEPVNPAITIDVTPEGFDAVESFVPVLLPSDLPLGDVGVYGSECWLIGGYDYGVEVSNMVVGIGLQDAQFTPTSSGDIDVHLELLINVNDAGNPLDLHTELICIGDDCTGYIDPFVLEADTTISLTCDYDTNNDFVLDADIGALDIVYTLTGNDVNLSGCSIATIDDILGFFGSSLFDLILPVIDSTLQDTLGSLADDLNPTIDEALAGIGDQLVIEQVVDVLGSNLEIRLAPSTCDITEDGLRFQMEALIDAETPHSCVAKYDTGESMETPSTLPGAGIIPAAVGTPFHASALIADEFLNQAMYGAWRTGVLCQELGGPEAPAFDLPIPIDSTLLALLAPGVYDDFFPESAAILLKTRPEQPPIVEMQPDDIDLLVPNLGLEIYTQIDGRAAKLLDVNLDMDVDLDITTDPSLGIVEVGIGLEDALDATVLQNEFVPGTDLDVEAGVEGLLSNPALSGLLDEALGGLGGIGLPPLEFDFDGDGIIDESLGIQDLVVTTAGDQDDFMGAYVWMGPVDYEYAGCSGGCGDSGCGESGCDESGCDTAGCTDTSSCTDTSGCASGGSAGSGCDLSSDCGGGCNLTASAGGRVFAVVFALLLIGLRRRD